MNTDIEIKQEGERLQSLLKELADALALDEVDAEMMLPVLTRYFDLAIQPWREKCAAGGPLHAERWTLKEFLEEMERVKAVASDKTCVSFDNFCWGAASLWHQTHRDNFKKINANPDELSRWILDEPSSIESDFPRQVLELLKKQKAEIDHFRKIIRQKDDALKGCEIALDVLYTFHRHSASWNQFNLTGKRDAARQALALA